MSNAKKERIEFRADPVLYKYLKRVAAELDTTPHEVARLLCETGLLFERKGLFKVFKGLESLNKLPDDTTDGSGIGTEDDADAG